MKRLSKRSLARLIHMVREVMVYEQQINHWPSREMRKQWAADKRLISKLEHELGKRKKAA